VTRPGECTQLHPLAPFGWDARVEAGFARAGIDVDRDVAGRVVRVDRGSCLVATALGVVRASPYGVGSRLAGLDEAPATGDWIALSPRQAGEVGPAPWDVTAIVARRSAVSRKEAEDRVTAEQVLVANVDLLGMVTALDRPVVPNRIERMLAAAWESRAEPVLLLTKADAAEDAAEALRVTESVAGGVAVVVTSTRTGQGIDLLRTMIEPARTLALIGPSGAGKSSLVNALAGRSVQSTGAVRDDDHRGRHTTTSRDLIVLESGGVLIDTPGLRALALWDAEAGVEATFTDIEDLAARCRFADCAHRAEPGCTVREAAASGAIEPRRLASYLKLQDELSELAARQEEQARRPTGRRSRKLVRPTSSRDDRR